MNTDKIIFGIAVGLVVVLTAVISIMGLFSVAIFFIILFFIIMFFSRYFYLKYWFDEVERNRLLMQGRKKKFDYCWRRVGEILQSMEGGQGIRWNSGDEVSSKTKSFSNGVAQKPFRAFLGYLEKSNLRVIIIYDIDEDDIAEINLSPTALHIEDMFYKFQPFDGQGNRFHDMGMNNGFDNYGRGRGINLNFNPNNPTPDYEPTQDDALKALDKLE